ncbi:hypothetical protein [Mesorhizobium sp. M7A.F.Ce.TU.012.03.2.1]|nr:hypothetical protein [Mesorhizobium sp. M7A.F.Ce.TU.012.03.2.1]
MADSDVQEWAATDAGQRGKPPGPCYPHDVPLDTMTALVWNA